MPVLVNLNFGNIVRTLYVPVFLLLTLVPGFAPAAGPSSSQPRSFPRVSGEQEHRVLPQAWYRTTHELRTGETLAGILRPLGVVGAESHAWFQEIEQHFPGADLAGQELFLYFQQHPNPRTSNNLRAIQIQPKPGQVLSWTLGNRGIVFDRRESLFPVQGGMAAEEPSPVRQTRGQPGGGSEDAGLESDDGDEARAVRERANLASVERITHIVRRGETMAALFGRLHVPAGEAKQWFQTISSKYSLKRLTPNRRVVLYFTTSIDPEKKNRGAKGLRAVQIETRDKTFLTWQKDGNQIVYRGKDFQNEQAAAMAALTSTSEPRGTKSTAGTKKLNEVKVRGRAARGTRLNGVHDDSSVPGTESLASLHHVRRQLTDGQTFAAIVKPLGVSGAESQTWFRALEKHPSGRNLGSGQRVDLYFEQEPAQERTGNLRAVQLYAQNGKAATWRLVGNHIYFGATKVVELRDSDSTENHKNFTGRYPAGLRKLPISEYALARVKQRNGLWAYTHPQTGHRPLASLARLQRIRKAIASGDNLLSILNSYGLSEEEEKEWLQSIQRHYVAERLQAGTIVRVYFGEDDTRTEEHDPAVYGPLKALEIELPADKILTWYRSEHGILFYKSEPPYDVEVKAVAGNLTNGSLYEAAARVGLHPAAIEQLVDIFGWDLNFETDLTDGDTFRVLYTRRYLPGSKEPSQIRVLAAQIVNRGKSHMAIYFENANGTGDYYDVNGRTVSRSLLRYPVEFLRISSNFSRHRFHPILRVRKPHRGVDFAAKRGTPVRTIGDGTVTYAAWKGAYGRFIEIDHGAGLKTRYAHLHRIGPGIKAGVQVKKGQVIGRVGCSGRCTGPHLHFEMWDNERYVNPLKPDLPPDDELDPAVFRIFEEAKASFLAKLTSDPK